MSDRPTPLTDAAEERFDQINEREHALHYFVPADFARRLERANAELMEALANRDKTIAEVTKERDSWRRTLEDMTAERDAALAEVARLKAENSAMRWCFRDIYDTAEGDADGTPDATRHEQFCNFVVGKALPYIDAARKQE